MKAENFSVACKASEVQKKIGEIAGEIMTAQQERDKHPISFIHEKDSEN